MKNNKKPKLPDWEILLSAQSIFQSRFPESILVGGTAAALHANHRVSIDADHILPDLKTRFAEILNQVENEAGWKTSRIEPPVLILGNFQGVRTGIRQLIRKKPLETTVIRGLRVPTIEEILRIKGYLIVKRNSTRDYIDFIALFDHLGVKKFLQALAPMDELYPQKNNNESVLKQLAMQLSEPKPWDLTQTELNNYKSLKKPYTDWTEIKWRASAAGLRLIEFLLG
ncbi:MAG: hypothetical protein HQM16_05375 [Deltaproteobacteria bacterium]|nr:hypothetical protein [Deltaproteobacteria bacterium]